MIEVLRNIGLEFWKTLFEMAPYLLFGFFVAGFLSVLISPGVVARHLGGGGIWPVIKSTLFGIPLPLCSCGVIPVAASLRRHGASRGATTAFLLSTPQTGVDSILVTYSLLGPVFAVVKPIAALVSGLFGGSLSSLLAPEERTERGSDASNGEAAESGTGGAIRRALAHGFVTLPRDIGKALLIGLAVAGLISALVPGDFFAQALGTGIGAMLVMMLVGIPIYVCATASVPVAAALIAKGVSPGAALVFLMTGPATNAATIATIWKALGRRTAIIYLITVALTALSAGMLLDELFQITGASVAPPVGWMLPGSVKMAAAFILLGVLVAALLKPSPRLAGSPPAGAGIAIRVSGMKCDDCADTVRRVLLKSPGVDSAAVDIKSGQAILTGSGFDLESIRHALEETGYRVEDSRGAAVDEAAEEA